MNHPSQFDQCGIWTLAHPLSVSYNLHVWFKSKYFCSIWTETSHWLILNDQWAQCFVCHIQAQKTWSPLYGTQWRTVCGPQWL